VVYVEFLLAFMPIFIFFMALIQLSLIYSAKLVVDHATYRALRSAIVVLDDDPRYYGGEPRLRLNEDRLTAGQLAAGRRRIRTSAAGDATPTNLSRRATIELAAGLVLMPLASGSDSVDQQATRTLGNMDVTLRVGSLEIENSPIGRNDEVIVRVEYQYDCGIPLGDLVCSGGKKLLTAEAALPNHGAPYPYLTP
jgi:hypothetical protein